MMPVDEPTLATVALLMLHVPPVVGLLSVVQLPTQTASEPEIAPGDGLTVISVVTKQPVPDTV
jgi:hypothetical protein